MTLRTIKDDGCARAKDDSESVSVFIPCYNETHVITRLLESLYHQDYPRSSMEIIIVDGMSTDDTREKIMSFAREHPDFNIRIIDNPKKRVTYAVNEGLRAAKGNFLVRMDAHSIPAQDYISRCIGNLRAGKGDNIGGLLDIQPIDDSYSARSIAIAAAHPLGTGGAQYRSGTKACSVDTVAFGAFTRETLEKNGFFNEQLMANEDYEWNTRLKKKGGRIWFDPAIRCQYFPRRSYRALAKQYFNYGYWKVHMLRQYPESLRLRQMAPAAVSLILLLSALFSILGLFLDWKYVPYFVILAPLLYAIALNIGCFIYPTNIPRSLLPGVVLAMFVMHVSWGSGFWLSLIQGKKSHIK